MDKLPKDNSNVPDYTFDRRAALALMYNIKSYWEKKGKVINIWLETISIQEQKAYVIRSNLAFKI